MGYKTYDCPIASKCGGCEWLNVPYPIQLRRKQEEVEQLFEGLCDNSAVYPIIGMDEPLHCRNKILAAFAPGKNGSIRYGLYSKGSHRIVQRGDCLVESPQSTPILQTIAKLARSFKLQPYDEKTGKGFLRYALIRVAHNTGEVLVCLVCTGEMFKGSKAFVKKLREAHPQIETVVLNINKRATNVIMGEKENVLYGKGWIEDELLGCRFRISATSFYQVNPIQTAKLYSEAIEMANLRDDMTILDAYCGTGTIGIIASKHAGQLIGVESNAAAVHDAKANARKNKIENARFITEDAGRFMRKCAENEEQVDVVFMDPPRAGSDEKFLKSLAAMGPKRVVYISCNPVTQVRDCEFLRKLGYRVLKVQPVDMFPHTSHVETVVQLSRISGSDK